MSAAVETAADEPLRLQCETVTLAGEQTRAAVHDGESLGGMVTSLMRFPEHGIVVSVTSNIPYADTFSFAMRIAEALAEQGRSPAAGDAPNALSRPGLVGVATAQRTFPARTSQR